MTNKKRAFIHPAKCLKCGVCPSADVCPAKSIEKDEDDIRYVTPDCTGCGKCVKVCRANMIELI